MLTALLLFLGKKIYYWLPVFHGPVFVPSTARAIATMIVLAKLKKSDKIIDMGSGDGEILLTLGRKGYAALGCEINPLLIRKSRQRIKESELEKLLKVKQQSFWDIDFSKYDVVFLYGTNYIMERLEKKLQQELKPGSRIVSNYFQFPNWQASGHKGKIRVYTKT